MTIRRSYCLFPAAILAGLTVLAACSSGGSNGENADSSEDDLSTWAAATAGRPTWATAANYRTMVGDTERVSVQVHMKLTDEAAADAELAAISDPDNAAYGNFLTTEQFAAKYAPADADIAAVKKHLERYGMTVDFVPGNKLFVSASGTHTQIARAFATKLGRYEVNGELRHAPLGNARIPGAIASKVKGTLGLSQSPTFKSKSVALGGIRRSQLAKLSGKQPNAGDVPANTCSKWWGQVLDTTDPPYGGGYADQLPYAPCGYIPAQLRAAYGFSAAVRGGNDGTGVKIAIIDAFLSPTLLQDAQTFAAQHDPDFPLLATQFSAQMAPGNPSPVDTGWYGEQTLDVEAVHAIAPGATIVYVGAQSPTDLDLVAAVNLIADGNLASIISNSYGSLEGQANDFVIWQAAVRHAGLKGIGVYFSSGDNGDESTNASTGGGVSADFPASLPSVTAVGGTSLALGQFNDRIFETGWSTGASFLTPAAAAPAADGDAGADAGGDAGPPPPPAPPTWQPAPPGQYIFAAGGGTSNVYDQPAWQKGIVPDAMANLPGAPARVVPDVGMLADPLTGFLVGQTDANGVYGEGVTGGTSLACPLFAASMALAQQHVKKPFGFANPLLYKKHAKAFKDVVPAATPQAVALPGGIIATIDWPGQTIHTAVGYDNITGLGAPDGVNFINALKK